MRNIFLICFILLFNFSFSQSKRIKIYYTNGSIEAIGKVVTCPDYNNKLTCDESQCKKIGKWNYFYQSGGLQRIENYKKIKDCYSNAIPDGTWQYFDIIENLIKEEEYKDGKLWNADISKYYLNDKLAGEVLVRNGQLDTLIYIENDSLNLIKNGNFDLFFDNPKLKINSGKNTIEDQIPYWITPNSNTPDYYNQFRKLSKVPDNMTHDYNEIYNYVGIILYHQPTLFYSEYITGELNKKLKPDKNYCFKITYRLSQNSGYFVDNFGVYFSEIVPSLPNTIEKQKDSPQLLFNNVSENRNGWESICGYYKATGNEKYITIGRFSSISETKIQEIKPENISQGELNQSAYYLFDKIEMFEDTLLCKCNTTQQEYNNNYRLDFDIISSDDSIRLSAGKIFVLRNIYFDFDKSILLPASFAELQKLLVFLRKNNNSITIMGHTDNIGTDEYNYNLSMSRAKAVYDWLKNNGIEPKRLNYMGFGASEPMVENNSPENRAINRRVEFKVNGN